MATVLLIRRTPAFLEDLFCACCKPAEVGWHLPVVPEKEKRKKLSKTEAPPEEPKQKKKNDEPDPYGWSCMDHVPAELVPLIPGARTLPILG